MLKITKYFGIKSPNSTCDEFISLQVSIDEQGRSCDPIYLYAQQQHIFAEGPDFLLSDAVLFPQFYLVMKLIQTSEDVEAKFRKFMPKSYAWFNRVNNEVENATQSCDSVLASESQNTVG